MRQLLVIVVGGGSRYAMKVIGPQDVVAFCRKYQSHKEYTAARKAQTGVITRWRWASGSMLPEIPLPETVHGEKPHAWADKPPKRGWLHGLDASGRIVYARNGNQGLDDEDVVEHFWIHEPGGYFWISFDDDSRKKPIAVSWYEASHDKWTRSVKLDADGISEVVLNWEGNRLASYESRTWSAGSTSDLGAAAKSKCTLANVDSRMLVTFRYAKNGELERVLETRPGEPRQASVVKYLKVPRGMTLKGLLAEAADLLFDDVVQALKAAKLKQPLYAVLVSYTGQRSDADGAAPRLLAVSEAVRQEIVTAEGARAGRLLYSAPALENRPGVRPIDCTSELLEEKLQWIYQFSIAKASPPNYAPVRKLFQQVCQRLSTHAWKGILKTTDDFVVLPSDPHEKLDLDSDLKACVSADRLRQLVDRGYVSRAQGK